MNPSSYCMGGIDQEEDFCRTHLLFLEQLSQRLCISYSRKIALDCKIITFVIVYRQTVMFSVNNVLTFNQFISTSNTSFRFLPKCFTLETLAAVAADFPCLSYKLTISICSWDVWAMFNITKNKTYFVLFFLIYIYLEFNQVARETV